MIFASTSRSRLLTPFLYSTFPSAVTAEPPSVCSGQDGHWCGVSRRRDINSGPGFLLFAPRRHGQQRAFSAIAAAPQIPPFPRCPPSMVRMRSMTDMPTPNAKKFRTLEARFSCRLTSGTISGAPIRMKSPTENVRKRRFLCGAVLASTS